MYKYIMSETTVGLKAPVKNFHHSFHPAFTSPWRRREPTFTNHKPSNVPKSAGYPFLTLELDLPYYALRMHKSLRQDGRLWCDGTRLRRSEILTFLKPLPDQQDKNFCLYEAQFSVVITGTSDTVYTACAFNDAYFDPQLRVQHYHDMTTKWFKPDPLTHGMRDANRPIFRQYEYFLDVVENHVHCIVKESYTVVQTLEQEYRRYGLHSNSEPFPLDRSPCFLGINTRINRKKPIACFSSTAEEMDSIDDYIKDFTRLAMRLHDRLAKGIDHLNQFLKLDVHEIIRGTDCSDSRFQMEASQERIVRAVSDLSHDLQTLERLRKGMEMHRKAASSSEPSMPRPVTNPLSTV